MQKTKFVLTSLFIFTMTSVRTGVVNDANLCSREFCKKSQKLFDGKKKQNTNHGWQQKQQNVRLASVLKYNNSCPLRQHVLIQTHFSFTKCLSSVVNVCRQSFKVQPFFSQEHVVSKWGIGLFLTGTAHE